MSTTTLGASQFASAMGIGASSRASLWRELALGQKAPVSEVGLSLQQYGKDHEADAVAYAEAASGKLFQHTGDWQKVFHHHNYSCHPDGLADVQALEVKCRNPGLHTTYLSVPSKHMPQVQGVLWLTNRFECVFACWHHDASVRRCWIVQRNDRYIEMMRDMLDEFCELVDTKTEPKRSPRKKILAALPKCDVKLIDGPPVACLLSKDRIGEGATPTQACVSAMQLMTNRLDGVLIQRWARWADGLHPCDLKMIEHDLAHLTPALPDEQEVAF